jgi:energy-coupling factor transporter transmembrane protein EcfT
MILEGGNHSRLGAVGYLAIFLCSLFLVMLVPQEQILIAAAICMVLALLFFKVPIHRLLHLRWLVFLVFLALPPVFFMGDTDRSLWGIGYSSVGLSTSLQIAVRFVVIIVILNGFTNSVDITSIAGMLERFGLRGLGFSMGVALNLLPSLQQSSINAWHSLWMRGGLRRQRWRGMRFLTYTIVTNALRRAEEIALAAEARAFSPEHSRPLPVPIGKWDWPIMIIAMTSMLGVLLLR